MPPTKLKPRSATAPTNADIYMKLGSLLQAVETLEANDAAQLKEISALKLEVQDMKITWNKVGGAIFLLGAVFSFLGYSARLIIDYVRQ